MRYSLLSFLRVQWPKLQRFNLIFGDLVRVTGGGDIVFTIMASQAASATQTVLPIFIHSRSLPGEQNKPFSVSEICGACERKTGYNSILGAQRLGVWRIYPANVQARTSLLLSGVTLRGVTVSLYDKNPLIVSYGDGAGEIKTTNLTIGNIPISLANAEIQAGIEKLGVKTRSALIMERDRDSSGGLTHWLTGRRFVYIDVPKEPLPKRIDLGPFKATLFHYEQKALGAPTKQCTKCLQQGHSSYFCINEVTCLECGKSGHKRGSPECVGQSDTSSHASPALDATLGNSVDPLPPPLPPRSDSNPVKEKDSTSNKEREGRPRSTQSKLSPGQRARSFTPGPRKRRSSPQRTDSPGKMARDRAWWQSFARTTEKEPTPSDIDLARDSRSIDDSTPADLISEQPPKEGGPCD